MASEGPESTSQRYWVHRAVSEVGGLLRVPSFPPLIEVASNSKDSFPKFKATLIIATNLPPIAKFCDDIQRTDFRKMPNIMNMVPEGVPDIHGRRRIKQTLNISHENRVAGQDGGPPQCREAPGCSE